MTNYIKEFIDCLIKEKGYRVIEINGEGKVPNIWCLSYLNVNVKEYFLILTPKDYDYISTYENIILSSTKNLNCAINIYKIFIEDKEEVNYFDCNSIILNFETEQVKLLCNIDEKILGHIREGFDSVIARKNKKNNLIRDNKATCSLILINIICFLLSMFLNIKEGQGILDIDIVILYKLGANVNIKMLGMQYYRYLTSIFLHGGVIHLFFNMYALYSIGPLVEQFYGIKNFLVIYIVSGLLGGIVSSFLLSGIAIGASGAIFGLLGATLVLAYKLKSKIGKDFLINIIVVIVINIFIGLTIPNIDNYAHVVGLISGIITSNFICRQKS